MIDNQRVFRFEVKTRFRFSSEGGVGKKTRFGGGRFVIGQALMVTLAALIIVMMVMVQQISDLFALTKSLFNL